MTYILDERRRLEAWGRPGTKSKGGDVNLVRIRIDGRDLLVNQLAYEAFSRWEELREQHGYRMPGTDTGFYSYRHMRHNPNLPWSVHAWAMAGDMNWLQNPAGSKLVTDMPPAFIADVLALRTNTGARVFRWGADWDWDGETTDHSYVDAMHWEVVAHPQDLASGIRRELDMTLTPEEIRTVKELHAAVKAVNSNGSFAAWTVTLIRRLREGTKAGQSSSVALDNWMRNPNGG